MNSPARTLHRLTLLTAVACGLITSASAQWSEKVLYSFQGGTDGAFPSGGLILDKAGNLYGTTSDGGLSSCFVVGGCGTVFKLSPPSAKGGSWTETVLYEFSGYSYGDGSSPIGVILDKTGNLYGVTGYGGTGPCILLGIATGCGTVYELSPPAKAGDPWTEKVLYSFQGGDDGDYAVGSLVFDGEGKLYGATSFGGQETTCGYFLVGCGTIFELSPPQTGGGQWTENVLHRFAGGEDGGNPTGGFVFDSEGSLYGTTGDGGSEGGVCSLGCGTVFRLIPRPDGDAWAEQILLRFNGQDGAYPYAGVIPDKHGNLYGTFYSGGKVGDGGVFELMRPNQKGFSWTEKVLVSFLNGYTGGLPMGGLLLDPSGNLYGTNIGCSTERCSGLVFELEPKADRGPSWADTTLYSFPPPPTQNGFWPEASLLPDSHGHLYTTTSGGGTGQNCAGGCGTVVELWPYVGQPN